jgi:hypothetical protein
MVESSHSLGDFAASALNWIVTVNSFTLSALFRGSPTLVAMLTAGPLRVWREREEGPSLEAA